MTSERLKQLLIKCMNLIEYDNDDVKSTFDCLGIKPEELKELGFGYISENSLDGIANDIMIELENCGFDDVTDSSGYFVIREFPDGSERCVDVYKSTSGGNPHYVVCCVYEDDEHDYEYTDNLEAESLIKVLREFYESEEN